MMLDAALLLASALAAAQQPSAPILPLSLPKLLGAPTYNLSDRAVENWRFESAFSLDLEPIAALRLAAGGDLAQTPRCVKLNNYWCIKHGGWVGEIAADGEGHVAFASADHGAATAALLLRRYYIDYKRHSARAIVSRWAPARCAPLPEATQTTAASVFPASRMIWPAKPAASSPKPPRKPQPIAEATPKTAPQRPSRPAAASKPADPASAGLHRMMPQRVVSMGLAPLGLENTLRARWLASHGRGGVAAVFPQKAKARGEAKAKPIRAAGVERRKALELAPAPEIAVGMGEQPRERPSDPAPNLTSINPALAAPAAKPADPPRPLVDACIGERERLANYAARVISGVVAGPDDDLALFSADGAPTDNLVKVMANMAAVEIGPLRASTNLIAAGIARMTRALAKPSAPVSPVAPVADNAPLPPQRP